MNAFLKAMKHSSSTLNRAGNPHDSATGGRRARDICRRGRVRCYGPGDPDPNQAGGRQGREGAGVDRACQYTIDAVFKSWSARRAVTVVGVRLGPKSYCDRSIVIRSANIGLNVLQKCPKTLRRTRSNTFSRHSRKLEHTEILSKRKTKKKRKIQ